MIDKMLNADLIVNGGRADSLDVKAFSAPRWMSALPL